MDKYNGIINVPAGSRRKYRVEHFTEPAGQEFTTASARCRIIGGQRGKKLAWPHETKWHRLSYSGGVWMTDLPCEIEQHRNCLKPIKSGSVLIGGLGLGVVLAILADRTRINRIVVVEKSREVIDLVWPHVKRDSVELVHADLLKWLPATREKFDSAFYDIWQSDGEGTFFGTVCPLLAASHEKIKRRPVCWNEDVMRGQLIFSLHSRAFDPSRLDELCTSKESIWWDWSVPFFRRLRSGEWSSSNAVTYAQIYGLPQYRDVWAA